MLGIFTDAIYALGIPSAFVSGMTAQIAESPSVLMPLFTVVVIAWALCFGLREMFIHQIRDEVSDRKCGTRTFVTVNGELTFWRTNGNSDA